MLASMMVPPAPFRFPGFHLPRVSHKSANDKGDKMIPGAMHRSPGICLTAEETPEKYQIGDRLMKVMEPVIALNGVPYLQMRLVGSHSTSGREKKGKDGVEPQLLVMSYYFI